MDGKPFPKGRGQVTWTIGGHQSYLWNGWS